MMKIFLKIFVFEHSSFCQNHFALRVGNYELCIMNYALTNYQF